MILAENQKIFAKRYSEIAQFEKLSYEDAKALYLEIQKETDEQKRKQMRSRLICGTQYNLFAKIKSNYLDLLDSNIYDMDDIINTAQELWISELDKGLLLDKNLYVNYFQKSTFFNELAQKLNDVNSMNITNVGHIKLAELFYDFIINSNQKDFDYNDFCNCIMQNRWHYPELVREIIKHRHFMVNEVYELLKRIYNILKLENGDFNISRSRFIKIFNLLMLNGYERLEKSAKDVAVCYSYTKDVEYDELVSFLKEHLKEKEYESLLSYQIDIENSFDPSMIQEDTLKKQYYQKRTLAKLQRPYYLNYIKGE